MYGQPGYPPSYGYPPGYMPTPMLRHREMPYNGGPVPPGAVVETRRMMSLVIGGGVLFGVGYLVSVLDATGNGSITCATSSCGASWLYVPIVGPWVALGYSGHPTADDVFIVLDGVAQAVGVVGFVVGMLNSRQVLVFNDMARRDLRRPRWMLTPGAPGAPAGATFSLLQF
jgi:hypothetical protein